MFQSHRTQFSKLRAIFSSCLLLWFMVTTVGLLAADLKIGHPDCQCGCQSGHECNTASKSCCSHSNPNKSCYCKNSKSCPIETTKDCCKDKPQPATLNASCSCGNKSVLQIVLTKPYDLPVPNQNLKSVPATNNNQQLLGLSPQYQDAPQTPPPQVDCAA